MKASVKLFFHYFTESIKEVRDNFKIYFVYIVGLCLVSMVQISFDTFFLKDDVALRFVSKILFSMVPLLILSKILYVIKIRHFGMAEYGRVMWRYILYTFYYFSILLLSLSIYVSAAVFAGSRFGMQNGYLMASFLLIPFIYVVIYYSLSPYVAVFNDEEEPVFASSKLLSSKSILLVIINHLYSFTLPLILSSVLLIENAYIKFATAFIFSIPEAIFAILMVLTTTKIYMYLTTRD